MNITCFLVLFPFLAIAFSLECMSYASNFCYSYSYYVIHDLRSSIGNDMAVRWPTKLLPLPTITTIIDFTPITRIISDQTSCHDHSSGLENDSSKSVLCRTHQRLRVANSRISSSPHPRRRKFLESDHVAQTSLPTSLLCLLQTRNNRLLPKKLNSRRN